MYEPAPNFFVLLLAPSAVVCVARQFFDPLIRHCCLFPSLRQSCNVAQPFFCRYRSNDGCAYCHCNAEAFCKWMRERVTQVGGWQRRGMKAKLKLRLCETHHLHTAKCREDEQKGDVSLWLARASNRQPGQQPKQMTRMWRTAAGVQERCAGEEGGREALTPARRGCCCTGRARWAPAGSCRWPPPR